MFLTVDSPDVAVVNVEGQAKDAEQDAEASKDRNGCKQLLRQEAVLFDHYGAIRWRSGA